MARAEPEIGGGMDFNKPFKFMRVRNGKEEFLEIIPNKLKGWKEYKLPDIEPIQIYIDESIPEVK